MKLLTTEEHQLVIHSNYAMRCRASKRKRNDIFFHIQSVECEPPSQETSTAACIDESSSSSSISFLEFRRSTIELYPSLNWLGPGVMAVHWFKEYLKREPFDWVQCPKQKPIPDGKREHKRRKIPQNSKGNFYFIPGQYLRDADEKNEKINAAKDLAIKNVLEFGTPGVHYATSYIGVYNLLRSYGKFATKSQVDRSHEELNAETDSLSNRCDNGTETKSNVFLVHYKGPPLPQ